VAATAPLGLGLAALGRLALIFVFMIAFWALWDQSGSEWVAVFAAQACLVALVVLVVVIVRLDRAAKDLRQAALDFRAEAEPALAELREVVRTADFELDRVDAIVSGAERVGGRVDAASDLAERFGDGFMGDVRCDAPHASCPARYGFGAGRGTERRLPCGCGMGGGGPGSG